MNSEQLIMWKEEAVAYLKQVSIRAVYLQI
jgi:hypothetical protein